MDNLLSLLKKGVNARTVTKWPGTDYAIELRVLSDQDKQEAAMAVATLYQNAGIKVGLENVDDYEAERTVQILMRAVLDPATHQPLTNDITEFRRLLTSDVAAQLLAEQAEWQRKCSPSPYEMKPEEFDALLLAVKKNAETTLGSVTSIATLKRLVKSLAALPPSLPMASGSI
jgi:hypothetical protein